MFLFFLMKQLEFLLKGISTLNNKAILKLGKSIFHNKYMICLRFCCMPVQDPFRESIILVYYLYTLWC